MGDPCGGLGPCGLGPWFLCPPCWPPRFCCGGLGPCGLGSLGLDCLGACPPVCCWGPRFCGGLGPCFWPCPPASLCPCCLPPWFLPPCCLCPCWLPRLPRSWSLLRRSFLSSVFKLICPTRSTNAAGSFSSLCLLLTISIACNSSTFCPSRFSRLISFTRCMVSG